MANPTGKGGFQPGCTGNPGGRPAVVREVRELAQKHSAEAIEVLVKIMQSEKAPLNTRAAAAGAILDRAVGRPEFSGKIETTHTKEANFDALTEAEHEVFLRLAEEISPFLPKLFGSDVDDPEGTVN
jgi:hypothetical protein